MVFNPSNCSRARLPRRVALSLIPIENSARFQTVQNCAFGAYSIHINIVADAFPEPPDADPQYSAD
jgi:hypothetical protein